MAHALQPADLWLPFEGVRDCVVLLQLPRVAVERAGEDRGGEEPAAKRARGAAPAAAAAADEEQQQEQQQQEQQPGQPGDEIQTVALDASAELLRSASEKFKAAMRWTEPGAAKQLVFQCRGEEEVESYRHLLAYVHSFGKELPQGPEALLSLLLLAREHAVEPAVAACLQLLLRQASQLPAIVCLTLLHELDTGCSAHDSVQAAAHQLASLSYYSMFTTLRAPATIADREVQAALLRYLGPLHDMLNDHHRRQLFMSLSFETVRDVILDNVVADTEATVLAAAAVWADRHLPPDGQDQGPYRSFAIDLCSRIRFPSISPHVLLSHRYASKLVRLFDPNGQVVLRAIVAAADPGTEAGWRTFVAQMAADDGDQGGEVSAAARQAYKMVMRWWTDRALPLQALPAPTSFEFQVPPPRNVDDVTEDRCSSTDVHFWAGYFWHARIERLDEHYTSIVVFPTVGINPANTPHQGKPSETLHRFWVVIQISTLDGTGQWVEHYGAPVCVGMAASAGLGADILWATWTQDGAVHMVEEDCAWKEVWDPSCKLVPSDGKARLRVQLSMATPAEIMAA